jgi:heat shock protein HslJ
LLFNQQGNAMKKSRIGVLAAFMSVATVAFGQTATSPAGRYAAMLPAADSPGRALLMILTSDHMARLTTDFKNGKPPIVESGHWKTADDKVVVTLAHRGTQALAKAPVLKFTASGDTLTGVDLDPMRWGTAGLVLTRDNAGGLIGGTWQMTRAVHGNDAPVVPKDPSHYTVQFVEDGTLLLLADCNHGHGSFTADPPRVHIGPAAVSSMMCPPGSLDTIFLRGLNAAATFEINDGELHLTTKDGTTTLTFDRVR